MILHLRGGFGGKVLIAGLFWAISQVASGAVSPVEATLGFSVGAYSGGSGWQDASLTGISCCASPLAANPLKEVTFDGGTVKSSGSATLAFAPSGQGNLTAHWEGDVVSLTGNTTPGTGVRFAGVFLPGSVYNTYNGGFAPLGTFAFAVGGAGSVAFNWSIFTTNLRDNEFVNNFVFNRRAGTQLVNLRVLHNGVQTSVQSLAQVTQRSSGSASLSFNALSGDTVVLELFPIFGFSADGAFTVGRMVQDASLSFAIAAPPVPEPAISLALLAGLGLIGLRLRSLRRPA